MNKNHEGYTDYTACEAVRRADRDRRQKKIVANSCISSSTTCLDENLHITYLLSEARGFREAANALCR